MPDVTGQLLVDLDDSGAFATNLVAGDDGYWKIEDGFNLSGRGRSQELDAAGMTSAVCRLDNADGRFTPKNGSSPYQSGGVNRFRPFKLARVRLTFDGNDYDQITGIIADVKVGEREQLCEITIRDFMFLLSRTEVRRPLMRDQRTGVILHRLLDDVQTAEGRGWNSNPRFEHNDSGYSTFGTATKDRLTTGFDRALILEGPASERVTTTAINSGLRFTMTGKNGQKGSVYAYVKPETDADIGDSVQVKMVDNVGTVAAGPLTAMANRDLWYRLEVSGTYNGGSTSQFIDVQAPLATSFRVAVVDGCPFVNAIARDIDDGQATLAYWTEYRGKAHEAIERVRRDEQFALFFFDGSGTAVFHDKTHRWRESHSLTVQSDFDERGILDYSELADDRIKTVRVDYPVHVEGTAGQVVAATDNVIPLPVGFRRAVYLDYDDGLAKEVIVPVANTDYTINAAADGTGADVSGSVTFEFEDLGSAAVGYFTNNTTRTAYLRTFQVRGTAVRLGAHTETATAVAAGGPALAAEHGWSLENNASEPYAQSGAEYVADRYSTQRERLMAVHQAPFPEPRLTSDAEAILARGIGDRVRYTQDNLPFSAKLTDADYYIDSIDLSIPGDSIQATWRLSPIDEDFYIIGDTLVGGEVLAP